MKCEKVMVTELDWEEMRDSGMLLLVNQVLHIFGRAICFDYDEEKKLKKVFFGRCKFRGFHDEGIETSYRKITEFMENNIQEIKKDLDE